MTKTIVVRKPIVFSASSIITIILILLLTACKEKYDYIANKIEEFNIYLYGRPVNTPDNPYKIALNINKPEHIGYELDIKHAEKFVVLDLSGSTFDKIDEGQFHSCNNLIKIILGNSIVSIGGHAFLKCKNLKSVTIPKSVKYINKDAFFDCSGLNSIEVNRANTEFRSVKGILYNKNKTKLLIYPQRKTGDFVIPNSVTVIEERAFDNCAGLTRVIIGKNVTTIGKEAFRKCTGLTGIIIPGNVVNIDEDAFSGCRNIESITISDSINVVLRGIFQDCADLTNVTLDNNVTRIWDYAFSNFSSLKQITIPPGVEYIGKYAFFNCTNHTSITIPAKVKYIGDKAFRYYTGLTSVTFENTIPSEHFNESAFNGDLREKFYETDKDKGTPGTYTTAAPGRENSTWTKK
jgi:hypothetical protein